jgi:hypothetical protein
MSDGLGDALDRAEERIESLENALGEGRTTDALEELRRLVELADEVESLAGAVDLTALPDAVDGRELLKAIDAGRVPEALAEGDLGDALDLKQLFRAVELGDALGATDKRKLLGAVHDSDLVGGDDGGSGLFDGDDGGSGPLGGDDDEDTGGVIAELTALLEDDDASDAESLVDRAAGAVSDAGEELSGHSDDGDEEGAFDVFDGVDPEAVQLSIQSKAMDAVDEFRAGVLEAHEALSGVYEKNQARTRKQREKRSTSRNPTAFRTIPAHRPDIGSATRYSTVPRQTRHSTAPNRTRIYGSRFDRENGDTNG